MKISLEWVSQYVDISDLDPAVIADKVTMSCAEVEGYTQIKRTVDGVLVGEIISVEKIPDKTDLNLVTVDCGQAKYTTVCSAPNVKLNMKSAFALAGTILNDDITVSETEMAGRRSDGILCSAKELGFSEFHEIILEVPNSIPNGTLLSRLVPRTDTILEIDNKSLTHRPDLWGHYGVAREIAAIFSRDLKPLDLDDLTAYRQLPEYSVTIDDLQECPCYCCLEMRNISTRISPLFMQWRLHAVGQRSIDLMVDLTNYIMFELGQPTHAFDSSKLKEIRIAPLGKKGTFTTLDNIKRDMLADDLMIWNKKEPIALAGIMGGQNSEVTPVTTKLLLESANFKATRIRRTATRLGLQSEASQRFEKNQPPVNAKKAIGRFMSLIKEAGMRPEVIGCFSFQGDLKEDMRPLEISLEFFNKKIGMNIPEEKITGILKSLGFQAVIEHEKLTVEIPPHRSQADISIPEDIVEETARVYGYDNIEPEMPDIVIMPVVFNEKLEREHKAQRILALAHNFIEIHSYAWFDSRWLEQIGYDPGPTLVLKNPSAESNSRLRTTIIPNLLSAVKHNILHRDSFNLFEIGRVFTPKGKDDRTETINLAGVSFAQGKKKNLEDHFRQIKGVLEDLIEVIGSGRLVFEISQKTDAPWRSPDKCLDIIINKEKIGSIGILPSNIADVIGPNSQVIWFELEFDKLNKQIYPTPQYKASSIYPGSWLDFSILWEPDKSFAKLEEKLSKFSQAVLERSEFLYQYILQDGQASYTFRYWIGSKERTLSGEEIDAFQNDFINFLKSEDLKLRQ